MKWNIFVLSVTCIWVCPGEATQVCYKRDLFGRVAYITCTDSCCGALEDKYCCQKSDVGIIAGCVVGVVVFFGIGVSVINCCCCRRNERSGYVKVVEGPANYESTTHYDIPRTPSGPQILVEESFREENRQRNAIKTGSEEEVVINVEVKEETKKLEAADADELVIEIQSKATEKDESTGALIQELVESTSNEGLSQDKSDNCTPTIVVIDADSPTGRHSYVQIQAENTFSDNCSRDLEIHEENENGHLKSCGEEVVSDCTPLLQEIDQITQQADVSFGKSKRKKILITDLDADSTEEISESLIFGDEIKLPSDYDSSLSGLTVSQESSTASDLTVTQEDSILSYIPSNPESLLPDLIISEEESLLSEPLQTDKLETSMGNINQTTERVYVHDTNQPYNPDPYRPVEAYSDSDPYRSGSVEIHTEETPRTEVFVDDGARPYDPPPANAYRDDRLFDPGPAGAYAYSQPAVTVPYNQPYGSQPADAYQFNQPADAFRNDQPFGNHEPADAFSDNRPYRNIILVEETAPYRPSVETYEVSDDQPSNAYD